MLARKTYIFLGVQAIATIGFLTGCVVTTTTTSGTGGTSSTSAGPTTGSDVGGAGGSGVGGSTSTATTGAGGAMCVGETGKGVVADCDNLNITPETHGGNASSTCGDNLDEDPPGYGLCTRGFALFNEGAATNLAECLATIGVQDACKAEPLQTCVDKMYKDECEIASIKTSCDGIKATCGDDPFDAAQCASDLNPFSDAGLGELSDCINATDVSVSCQKAYDDCYTEVLTF